MEIERNINGQCRKLQHQLTRGTTIKMVLVFIFFLGGGGQVNGSSYVRIKPIEPELPNKDGEQKCSEKQQKIYETTVPHAERIGTQMVLAQKRPRRMIENIRIRS